MIGSGRGIAAIAVVLVAGFGFGGAAHADAAGGEQEQTPAGPADVAIPYDDTASIEPQAPWRVADCAAVRAASELVASCDAESIVLSAAEYDPDAGVAVLPVALTSGARTMTVHYRVSLEAPPAPGTRAVTGRAIAAGALLRVPLSEFALTCTVCAAGGSTRILAVDPAEAGSAWTTPTHVVFRASRAYRGPVDVHVGVADDFGTTAQTGVSAHVYPARDTLVALDMIVPVDERGDAQIDLSALTSARSGADVDVVGCGAAVHGSIACADGIAQYGAGAGSLPDQFAFHVVSGADQAWGSVTLVATDEPGGVAPTVRRGEEEPVAMAVLPPAPPDGAGRATGGLFAPFTAVLDRAGAR